MEYLKAEGINYAGTIPKIKMKVLNPARTLVGISFCIIIQIF
jgi:hypothetical protein